MKNAIAVLDHSIPKGSRLEKSEKELAEAMHDCTESFFRQGVILERIKSNEEFQDAGYQSFREYMDDRKPLGIEGRFADKLIKAKTIRLLLPKVSDTEGPRGTLEWTEKTVRPLTHKDFKPADVRRLGKKILRRVKRGERLTHNLVKEICNADRGIERKKNERKAKIFKEASLANNLSLAIEMVMGLRVGFQNYYEDAWLEVEESNPGLIRSLVTELENFTSYLKE